MNVEVQDSLEISRLLLVFLDQLAQCSVDLPGRNANLVGAGAVFTGAGFLFPVGIGAVGQQIMELFDEALGQRCGNIAHHMLNTGKMVDGFDDVVHLHGFEGGGNLVGAVDLLHLGAC